MSNSPLEARFENWLILENINDYVREYKYCPTRKWKADFAFVNKKILIELNGIDHFSNWNNIKNDYEKWNWATMHGWKVFLFSGNYTDFESIKDIIK